MDYEKVLYGSVGSRGFSQSQGVGTGTGRTCNDWSCTSAPCRWAISAALVAQMPAWIAMMLTTTELNLGDKASSGNFQAKASDSKEALLKLAADSQEKAKSALANATEEDLDQTWSFKNETTRSQYSGPRHQQIADAFTHLSHHRGQLTVYLRLNEVPVPAIFVPSADERVT